MDIHDPLKTTGYQKIKITESRMSNNSKLVNSHYGANNLSEKIKTALIKAGKDTGNLSLEDISTFEDFHIGGKEATHKLAELVDFTKDMKVLDIGSGLGGPSRTLAADYGCKVTGIDLTREFVDAAKMLSSLTNLESKVNFIHGSGLEIPVEDGSFDLVWMQHVGMNIENKAALYKEIKRVLIKNGLAAFYEILKGNDNQIHFPVFWAEDKNLNFLITENEMKQALSDLDFKEIKREDATAYGISQLETRMEKNEDGLPPLTMSVIVEKDNFKKAKNVLLNLKEEKIKVVRLLFRSI